MSKTVGSPRSKKSEELVHRFRALFLRALDIVEERGQSPAELLAKEFVASPLNYMAKAAPYMPKDLNVNHSQEGLVEVISALQKLRQSAANQPPIPVDNTNPTVEQPVTH